jgi:hypothetical protein
VNFHVYIIGPTGSYPVKIGCAEKPTKRLLGIQTSCWEELMIHGLYKADTKSNAYRLEKLAHKRLDKRRMMGEWFNVFVEDAVSVLDEICKETRLALKLLKK